MHITSKRGLGAAVGCGLVTAISMFIGGCSSAVDPTPTPQSAGQSSVGGNLDRTDSFVGAAIPSQQKIDIAHLVPKFAPINCPTPQALCGQSCASLATDSQNCGACGNVCGDGLKCSNGACAATCGEGTLTCGDSCIDPQTSQTHCGAKDACDADAGTDGLVCGSDEACVQGECYQLQPYLVGHIKVSDGPGGDSNPRSYSCRESCAESFGDEAKDYHCSTSADSLDNRAWGSNFGKDKKNCIGGINVPEDFISGDTYNTAGAFSAWVNDACDDTSINYCWRIPPSRQQGPKNSAPPQVDSAQ